MDNSKKNEDSKLQIQGSNLINSESAKSNYIELNNNNQQVDDKESTEEKDPRFKGILVGIKGLSLGFSIVVAILLGVGVGILLKKIFDVYWVFWIGVIWGVCAAVLNVYKAYKSQLKEFDKLANDPKYSYKKQN